MAIFHISNIFAAAIKRSLERAGYNFVNQPFGMLKNQKIRQSGRKKEADPKEIFWSVSLFYYR